MAVVLYKKTPHGIDSIIVEPRSLKSSLANGWQLEIVDDPLEGLSNEDVRLKAKDAGIEDWETARIKTLKEALTDAGDI